MTEFCVFLEGIFALWYHLHCSISIRILNNLIVLTELFPTPDLQDWRISIYRLSIIWKSDLTDKMKCSFFQAAVVSILLYGCTTWTLTKRLEKKLDGNYTRMLRAILNKSWRQHPTSHQLYGHLPHITITIQARRTRHARQRRAHKWCTLMDPAYGQAKAGRPARTYIQQLCEDTGCSPEDLPEARWMIGRSGERGSGVSVLAPWWWWWYIQEMESPTQVQVLDEITCFSRCVNCLGKGMNPTIFPPAIGK